MGIQLEKRELPIARLAGQGLAEISLQRSAALPSDLPDMSGAESEVVLWAGGTPVVNMVESNMGEVRIEGHIHSRLLYISHGEPGTVHGASLDEPRFEATIPVPGATPGMDAEADVRLVQFSAESTGPRGISFTAALAVRVDLIQRGTVDAAVSVQASGGSRVSVLTDEVCVKQEVATVSDDVPLSETLELPEDYPVLGNSRSQVGAAGAARIVGTTVSEGRVTVDAEIAVEAAYAVPRGVPAVNILSYDRIGIRKTFEVPEARKGMKVTASATLSRLAVTPDPPRTLVLEGVLSISATVAESRRISVITDIISESTEIVDAQTETVVTDQVVAEERLEFTVEESVSLHAAKEQRALSGMEEVRSTRGAVCLTSAELFDGEVAVRGSIAAHAIFGDVAEDEEGQFPTAFAVDVPVEFSDSADVAGVEEDDRVLVSAAVEGLRLERPAPSKLELEAVVRVDVSVLRERAVAVVTSAEMVTPVRLDPYSMTFYVAGPRDTLGRIAKRYGVPPDRIAAANNMSPTDTLSCGQKIYIPARL
ncbi:MAG: DUF3794 domain-containing protein [Firmicutes bacterium]|nr:DUF3794 domain-containing protein [Bacillota bacterium]